jgi:hypothetical protein
MGKDRVACRGKPVNKRDLGVRVKGLVGKEYLGGIG